MAVSDQFVKLIVLMVFISPMNFRTFDLNLLRVLDAMLATNSTVAAGKRLGMSQPAVSSALGRLRNALNDPLFVRQGQRLEATDFARSLATPLRSQLDTLESLLSGPKNFDPSAAVLGFRLSGNDFFGELLMPPLGAELARRAPGVRVQLFDIVPNDLEAIFDRYAIDVALQPRSDFPEWVEEQPLFRSGFALVARSNHPRFLNAGLAEGDTVSVDLYCDLGHVLMSPEGRLTSFVDTALRELGHSRTIAMTLPTFAGVYRAVAESDMVAMMPKLLARKVAPTAGLSLYEAPVAVPGPLISMIWHRRASHNPAHQWMRGLIAGVLAPLSAG